MATMAICRGMAGCWDNSAILVALRYPLMGVRMTSRWPALISPRPRIMMGVMDMIVIIMTEVNTSKHIVETERQLKSELLLILTWQSLLLMVELLYILYAHQKLRIHIYYRCSPNTCRILLYFYCYDFSRVLVRQN